MVGRGRHASVIAILVPPGSGTAGKTCQLDEHESHHLRVRRAQGGERVLLRDGAGLLGSGTLVRSGDAWTVEIERAESAPRPAELLVAVGAGDRDRFAWLVEKATELGVTSVVPIETERTSGVATRLTTKHLERLRRQALEAIKQSGAPWATVVADALPLERFLSEPRVGQKWLADAAGSAPAFPATDDPVSVLVGPEGGLSLLEREAAVAAGYHPVKLGGHTLRFETAAIVAAAVVNAARLRGTDG
jgi:16S rRNA (uracil1498-N3)-methyltransferase